MDSARPTDDVARIARGTVIANYVVEDFVGQGTEGCVYVARDSVLGRQVALKTLRVGEAGETRGVEEARLLAQLEHPHIVRVYHARRHQGVWVVVSEYLAGGSLQSQLQRVGSLPLRRALELTAQAASGLAHAHAAHILHRDVKPQNMLLSKTGEVKLADFGLALDVRTLRRGSQQAVGTPAFLAPELWSGEPASQASDVWSLGACLFCLLTGRLPFVAQDAEQLRRAQEELEPKLPLTLPPLVRELVLRMMSKDAAARPASESLVAALRALADNPQRATTALVTTHLPEKSPFNGEGPDSAVRATLRRGRDAAYLDDLVAALRAQPRGILLAAPTVADALLLSELARETPGNHHELFARLTLTKAHTTLSDVLQRRLELPLHAPFSELCERTLSPARELAGSPAVELCAPQGLAAEQWAELEEFVEVARRCNVACIVVVPKVCDGIPHGFRQVTALLEDALIEFEARLERWIEIATSGRYAFSRDGLRLAGAICKEEGSFWPRLAQDSVLFAAAAGLPVVTTWAVLNARAQATPCHSVDDVPAVFRRRPLNWPPPAVATLLMRLRSSGEAQLGHLKSSVVPPAAPAKDLEFVAQLRNDACNT